MDWGANFSDALIRFEQRISTASIARTVTLITKASEMSGQIGEVLAIAASDAKMSETLKKERLSEMFIYTAIVYLSFFVFLYVVAVLDTQFLPGPCPYWDIGDFNGRAPLRYRVCADQSVQPASLPRVPDPGALLRFDRRADGGGLTCRWCEAFLYPADHLTCYLQFHHCYINW